MSDLKKLAREVSLPEATVRGAISYYSDLPSDRGTIKICQGTSCMLAGAGKLRGTLKQKSECKSVYCLGYCDRSPTLLKILKDREEVICGDQAAALIADEKTVIKAETPALSIRCLAPKPTVTTRIGADYSNLQKAKAAGVYSALAKALEGSPEDLISAVERSGERGRGGAAFRTGTKWRHCFESPQKTRYVIANGDEGDPGSFIDRLLMENDPHSIIESLILCGYAVSASQGIVFVRSEYPKAMTRMREAITEALAAGILGSSVMGSNFSFEISVFPGMGSYVCGEATAMLEAIEGLRGEVRLKPPHLTESGLYGKPTVVNNVETLINICTIVKQGAEIYAATGTPYSSGSKAMCLNHGFARPGIVEVEFGTSLQKVIEEAGGGAGGKKIEALLLGGPMGSLLLPQEWDVPICYEAMAKRGIQLGHGGMVALLEGTDYRALLEHWLCFMKEESCGKCAPCRLGAQKAWNLMRGNNPDRAELERLFEVIEESSLCAFGQYMPAPMRQIIEHFGDRIFTAGGEK